MKKIIIQIGISVLINLVSLISLIVLTCKEEYKFVLIILSFYVIGFTLGKQISNIIDSEYEKLQKEKRELDNLIYKTLFNEDIKND